VAAVEAAGWAAGSAVGDSSLTRKLEGKVNKSTFVWFEPCCFPTHPQKAADGWGTLFDPARGLAKPVDDWNLLLPIEP
jgi:hypothetical protein